MLKILVVEDDEKIADILVENLLKAGYEAVAVTAFADVLPEFIGFKPDLVLLDIVLPCYDGFYWCGQIRLISTVPIIFISSRSADMDIIIATNMGGDDYLIKPFSIDILLAKVAGLLRRTYSYDNTEMDIIAHEGLIFNIASGVVFGNENSVKLSKNEAQILTLLLKNRGKTVSRERIIRSLWKDETFIDDNTLTVNITRLRKRLKDLGLENVIETKKNQGYLI